MTTGMVGTKIDALILARCSDTLLTCPMPNVPFRSYTTVGMGPGRRPGSRESSEIRSEQREVSAHACYVGRCHDHSMGHSRSAAVMGGVIRRSYR